ncbi:ladderlectin-like isoform X2 [Hippocampus comes]|uniref:Ladderlectin-like n=1 Tax=Hippocampus comes TaxID=109280 RepID=A0A3Q2YP01_HIPCM|nr:PREDICTED: ladderlectin-like isoform X2 [Hippocampus comes]
MAPLHLLAVLCGIIALSQADRGAKDKDKNHCPKGWTQLDNKCYIFFHNPRTFPDAERVCNVFDGNLVSIDNRLENAFVVELIREGAGSVVNTWIGLFDTLPEDDFIWTDGEDFKFSNFAGGQPDNNGGNENCVEIQADSTWNDNACTVLNPYVCCRPAEKKDCH